MQLNNRRAAHGRPVGRAVAAAAEPEDGDEDEARQASPPARAAGAAGGGGGKATPAARIVRVPWYYGAALLLFGVPFWPVSAWFLASGWIEIVNSILVFLDIPASVPALAGWLGLGVAVLVGATYSRVELSPPLRGYAWRSAALLWAAWAAVMLSDVGATYRGLSRESALGVAMALLLTFAPDQAIMRGWRIVRGRSPF